MKTYDVYKKQPPTVFVALFGNIQQAGYIDFKGQLQHGVDITVMPTKYGNIN